MQAAILGKKIGMTRVFAEDGTAVPVTVVQAGPCPVLQVRTKARDGYEAVQLGYEAKKPSRSRMPEIGHAKKAQAAPQQFIREFPMGAPSETKEGDVVTVGVFEDQGIRFVDVVGTSIGKGFQGVVKRYHFAGQESSHGTERKHRSAGSIQMSDRGEGRGVKKGKKMPGHMGHERCTVRNLKLVSIDKERNLLLIKGAVPGPRGGYLAISKAKTRS